MTLAAASAPSAGMPPARESREESDMKKKIGSLQLHRETVTRLTSPEMQGAVGGVTKLTLCRCNPTYPTDCACTFTC
jgi:hypothetical protein